MVESAYDLIVHDDEQPILRLALEVYRDDFGRRERNVTRVVDRVLTALDGLTDRWLPLAEADLKVTWSALHALLDDSRRDQPADREHLRALLDRLPGAIDMRLIDLDDALERERRNFGAKG